MLYNTENPPEKNKNIILCPIIAILVAFILKFFLDFILYFELHYYYFRKYLIYLISLIIFCIDFIGTLVAAIFVTISFEKRKYCFYKTGLIIVLVLAISMTLMLLVSIINNLYIFEINILFLAVEWSDNCIIDI